MPVITVQTRFEEFELNDAKACVLREMNEELGLCEDNIRNLSLRYVTLRRTKGEIRQNYYFSQCLMKKLVMIWSRMKEN